MDEVIAPVNWIAVAVGFIVSFALGWVWYSPKCFGKKWAEGVGVDLEDTKEMPVLAMVAQAICTFLLSWLIGITAASNALLTAILIILCVTCFIISNGKYVKKSNKSILIESSYILVMGVVMIISQGIF